jgi:hypothetical protein
MFGREDFYREKIRYCFDLVADRAGSRLLVAAGDRGPHLFDLDHGSLRRVTTHYEDGYYRNLKVRNDRAYVADARRVLVVLDITSHLPTTTWIQYNSPAYGLGFEDNLAFVAACDHGLQVFDLTEPDLPAMVGSLETLEGAWDVWVYGSQAFVADLNEGPTVVDVSSPSDPRYVTTVTRARQVHSAEIVRGEGTMVYVVAANHGLILIDVSDPRHPELVANTGRAASVLLRALLYELSSSICPWAAKSRLGARREI